LLLNHQGNDPGDVSTFHGNQREPAGVVVDVYWHTEGLVNVVRLYNSITGTAAATAIASGNLRCVSLYHASIGDRIQLREISLCLLGKRPGARLLEIRPADYQSLPSPGPYCERPFTDNLVDLRYLSPLSPLINQASLTNPKEDVVRVHWDQLDEELLIQCCEQKWPVPQLATWRDGLQLYQGSERQVLIHQASAWLRCYHVTVPPILPNQRFLPWLIYSEYKTQE
jgi:hypothetical protein